MVAEVETSQWPYSTRAPKINKGIVPRGLNTLAPWHNGPLITADMGRKEPGKALVPLVPSEGQPCGEGAVLLV